MASVASQKKLIVVLNMCTTWTAKSQIFLLQGAIAMELAIHQQNAQIREALQVATVQQGKFSEYYFFRNVSTSQKCRYIGNHV